LAAFVPFPIVKFQAELLKSDTPAFGLETNPGSRLQRNQFRNSTLRGKFVNAEVIVGRVAPAAEEDLAIGSPAQGLVGSRMISQATRLATRRGHHVHIVITFVLRGEGDHSPVRGKFGKSLLTLERGQPQGDAACQRHLPEVALGSEDDGVPADRRVTVETIRQNIGSKSAGDLSQQRQTRNKKYFRELHSVQLKRFGRVGKDILLPEFRRRASDPRVTQKAPRRSKSCRWSKST